MVGSATDSGFGIGDVPSWFQGEWMELTCGAELTVPQ
jgi:hypothetical protein